MDESVNALLMAVAAIIMLGLIIFGLIPAMQEVPPRLPVEEAVAQKATTESRATADSTSKANFLRQLQERIDVRQPRYQPLFIYDEQAARRGECAGIEDATLTSISFARQPIESELRSDSDGFVSLDALAARFSIPEGGLLQFEISASGYGSRVVRHHLLRFLPKERLVATSPLEVAAYGLYPAKTVLRGSVVPLDQQNGPLAVEIARWQHDFCWPLSVERFSDGKFNFEQPVWELVLPEEEVREGDRKVKFSIQGPLDLELTVRELTSQNRSVSASVNIWNLPRGKTTDLEALFGSLQLNEVQVRIELREEREGNLAFVQDGTQVTIDAIRGTERFDSFQIKSKEGKVELWTTQLREVRFDDLGELLSAQVLGPPRLGISLVHRGRSIDISLPSDPTSVPVSLEANGMVVGKCDLSTDAFGRTIVVARLVL